MLLLAGFHLHAAGVRTLLDRRRPTTVKLVDGTLLTTHIIAYPEAGFFASYAQVLQHLHTVGGSLRPELEY